MVNTAQSKLQGICKEKYLYPIANYVGCTHFSSTHQAYLATITAMDEPKRFATAVTKWVWRKAMRNEIDALEENNTWTLEELPPWKQAIVSEWVYKIKHKSDGSIECYKALLVALENKQIEGVAFAPVVKMETVRLFLQVATGNN